jgi:hypothetical protein
MFTCVDVGLQAALACLHNTRAIFAYNFRTGAPTKFIFGG